MFDVILITIRLLLIGIILFIQLRSIFHNIKGIRKLKQNKNISIIDLAKERIEQRRQHRICFKMGIYVVIIGVVLFLSQLINDKTFSLFNLLLWPVIVFSYYHSYTIHNEPNIPLDKISDHVKGYFIEIKKELVNDFKWVFNFLR